MEFRGAVRRFCGRVPDRRGRRSGGRHRPERRQWRTGHGLRSRRLASTARTPGSTRHGSARPGGYQEVERVRRYLPSTMMLQAFEASAKRLSFTLAAEDLCLTQSAISKQVIALEEMLRTELFKRIKKRLELTPAGKNFQARISPALNGIEAAVI